MNIWIIIIVFLVKLSLAFLPGFKIDMDAWVFWAHRLQQLGPINFYDPQIWTNYTPGYLYILWIFGWIITTFHLPQDLLELLIKLPSITAEIILGIVTFNIVKKQLNGKLAALSFLFIALNPMALFNSSVWGQIDGLLALAIFLSIYYLQKQKLYLASFLFGIAFLIKPQAIAVAPLFLLFLIKNFSLKNIVSLTLPGLIIFFGLAAPFFPKDPLFGLPKLIFQMSKDYSATSLFAYNFWGVGGFWVDDNIKLGSLTYQQWGIIGFIIYWIIISGFYLLKKPNLFIVATLALLGFYFIPTRVHERYLYPAIPFMLISSVYLKSRSLLIAAVILSFINFLNLYYVYIYYQVFYLKLSIFFYSESIYKVLDSFPKLLSLLSTTIFISAVAVIFKSDVKTDTKK